MLNHSSHPAHGFGRLRNALGAMRLLASVRRTAPRRWPGPRLGETATGVLLLLAILAGVCACLLLLDHLGVPPAATTDFPLID